MSDQSYMPKVEFEKDEKLKSAHAYSKFVEEKNLARAAAAKKTLVRQRTIFTASIALVLSIYTYTIVRVKQETFLDDFEEPPRIIKRED